MMTERDFEQWLSRLDAEQQNAPDDLDLDAELRRVVERGNEIRRQRATEYSAAVDRDTDTPVVRPWRVGGPTPRRAITTAMATAAAVICLIFIAASLASDRSAPQYHIVADSYGIEVEFVPDTVYFQAELLKKEVTERVGINSLRDYRLTVTASSGPRGNADAARVLAVERLNAVVSALVSIGLDRKNISDSLTLDGPSGVLVRETIMSPGQTVTLPPPPPAVAVSKGQNISNPACKSCNYVHISMRNFAPNTSYTINCAADSPGGPGIFFSYSASTDNTGTLDSTRCFFGYSGSAVWAVVNGVESNHVNW